MHNASPNQEHSSGRCGATKVIRLIALGKVVSFGKDTDSGTVWRTSLARPEPALCRQRLVDRTLIQVIRRLPLADYLSPLMSAGDR